MSSLDPDSKKKDSILLKFFKRIQPVRVDLPVWAYSIGVYAVRWEGEVGEGAGLNHNLVHSLTWHTGFGGGFGMDEGCGK